MASTFVSRLQQRFLNAIKNNPLSNMFNRAFYSLVGNGSSTTYDAKMPVYIEKGYNINSIVYACISQMSTKTASIPYYLKKSKGKPTRKAMAMIDADAKGMPLDRPNLTSNWWEWFYLIKAFLRSTGNVYIYNMSPDEGPNAGVPLQSYILPSHLIKIVLKPGAKMMNIEDPIDYYCLIDGETQIKFYKKDIIHIKLPNVNFNQNGEHLYGQSPLRAALRNIESSNEAVNQNIKTLKNSGAFGFIHGKSIPLTSEQAATMRERMVEMDNNPERMAKIAGMSQDIGYTRISLTTDELKPFEFLSYDEKQICNALGWSDKLLNNDAGAKYDNVNAFRKQVVIDNIMPDLILIEQALNTQFFPKFKDYQGFTIYFDYSALPEMQTDLVALTNRLSIALKDGAITRAEYRAELNYEPMDTPGVEELTVATNIMPLSDAVEPLPTGP